MRSLASLVSLWLAVLAAPAVAGPGTVYDLICGPSLRVVGGAEPGRFVRPGASLEPGARGYGSQCVEGCYVEPLRLVPDGALPRGRRYLALLAPAGGAMCTSTASVIAAFPLDTFDALGALLGA